LPRIFISRSQANNGS